MIAVAGLALKHLVYVHHGDAAAPAVLEEFGVDHRTVMVNDVRCLAVPAEDNVRRITDQGAIESVRMDHGSAHNRVRCVVVLRSERRIEVDCID